MNKRILDIVLDYAYIKKLLKLKIIDENEYKLIKEKVDKLYL